MLGVVLVRFESAFGIPRNALYLLAGLPCIFALYDFFIYLKAKGNLAPFLKGIAIVNMIYCCLSVSLAFHHHAEIQPLGWAYIVLEIMVVMALSMYELKVAKEET